MATPIPYKFYKVDEGNGRTGYYAVASTNTPHGYTQIDENEYSQGLQAELAKEKGLITSAQAQAQGLGAGARYDQQRIDNLSLFLNEYNSGKYAGPSGNVIAVDPLTGQSNQMTAEAAASFDQQAADLASGKLVKTGQEGVYVPAGSAALQELQNPGSTGTTTLPGPTNPVKVGTSEGPGAATATAATQPVGGISTAPNAVQAGQQIAPQAELPQITQNLGPGSTGAEVAALQNWLISQGYSIPAIQNGSAQAGFYGDQTVAAVTQWQQDNGIIPDNPADYGYFGPKSRSAMMTIAPQSSSLMEGGAEMGASMDSAFSGGGGNSLLDDTISNLRSLYGLGPADSNKTPVQQALDDYKEIYSSLGISDIKKSYEDAVKQFGDLKNELGDKIADVNEDPWLTEGVRQGKIKKLAERYETKMAIATNLMQLYDSQSKQAMAQADTVIGMLNNQQARSDAVVSQAIDLVQKQIDAQKKLAEIDPSQYREVQGGLYDIKNNKWIVQPKADTSEEIKLTATQKASKDNLNAVLSSLDSYRALYDELVGDSGVNLTGTDAGRLSGAYNALIFQIAQAAGTGALQAADREVVEAMIPNPTTFSGAVGGFVRGGKLGGLGAIDEARKLFENKLNNVGSSTLPQDDGFNPYAAEYNANMGTLSTVNPSTYNSTPATNTNTGIIGWLMGN